MSSLNPVSPSSNGSPKVHTKVQSLNSASLKKEFKGLTILKASGELFAVSLSLPSYA